MQTNHARLMLWPYDEVTLSSGHAPNEVAVIAPWLTINVTLEGAELTRAQALVEKFKSNTLAPEDLANLSWFFRSLAEYAFAYILPRPDAAFINAEPHAVIGDSWASATPAVLFGKLIRDLPPSVDTHALRDHEWIRRTFTWDADAALAFAKTGTGADPYTIFSVARRFHLLDTLQDNVTAKVLEFVSTMPAGSPERRQASALIVRQNHYVTEKCDASLRPAVDIAQSAAPAVDGFIRAERGHDRILEKALKSLTPDPLNVPVLPSSIVLMEILRLSASRNLLGFACVVDIFERSAYSEDDPLAALLKKGGHEKAAHQINVHKNINDAGGHENVALSFLAAMGPVSDDYVREALQFAELATTVVHLVSDEILRTLRTTG